MKLTAPFLVLSLGVLAASTQRDRPLPNAGGNGLCRSQDCVSSAKAIIQNMNTAIDPCKDFHEFACGSYFKRTKVPKGKNKVGGLSAVEITTNKIIHRILTTDPKKIKGSKGYPLNDVSRKNLEKAQLDFASCMDESRINAIGRRPLLNDLKQLITKTFPVRNSLLAPLLPGIKTPVETPPASQATDRDRLTSALIQLIKDGVEPLVDMTVTYKSTNPALQQLYIFQGRTGIARRYYEDKKALKTYRKHVKDMFTLFLGTSGSSKPGKKRTRTLKNAKQLANYVVDHESRVAKINMTGDPGENNLMTAQKMNEINPAIDWPRFLQATAKTDKASMASQNYQKALPEILKNTTDAGLQVYFAWHIINVHYSGLSAKYRVPMDKFASLARGEVGIYKQPKHVDHCVGVANRNLGAILGQFYLSVAFSPEMEKKGREIIDAVQSTYRIELGKADWLDEATRKNAIKKLEAIDEVVAYSRFDPNVASAQSLATYYRTLKMRKNDFYGNQKRARAWRKAKKLAKAGKPTNRRGMEDDPQEVNALNLFYPNQIFFPAGIMQKPMFAAHNPEYLNFGGLGHIVGHEITHGFDNNGRFFGPDGKIENWWTNATATRFEEKAKCYVDQYNKFTIVGPERKSLHVNGTLTLGENISDNGGLKMAFKAWSTRFASDPKGLRYNNKLLPGLQKYSREQLFFINLSQTLCVEDTPKYLSNMLRLDEHSPARARVNGAAANSPDFARAFKCKRNAKMNPAKKCEIW
ncbi:hypothetical protein DFQ27_002034 [Actinomortierella ambigua]|uniref:Uncharacterized protein n=1 Tax=Actinomortierella ambigua TaxID=1343610 RepID=A0A9P6U7F8_9FUNG|nr:hypothetical protein DFQ27_002034 [Actinomortierella ambigua]